MINLGIMGINTDQEAMILADANPYFRAPALALNPDIVIVTFCVNDIELMPDPKPRPETIFLPKLAHDFLRGRYLCYRLLHDKLNQLLCATGMQQTYTEYLQHLYQSDTKEWTLFTRYLTFIIQVVQQQRKQMLLVIFPDLGQLDASHPFLDLYAKVTAIGQSQGIEVLNLFPYFQGKPSESLTVSLFNGHPNAAAYEIASEAVYKTLIKQNML